jgi:hypothetical protein
MTSIGYSGGASGNKRVGWSTGSSNVTGMSGYMAPPVVNHDNAYEFAKLRLTLREVWNNQPYTKKSTRIITPFRAINNSGDILSRSNYSCGGTCQSFQSRPGLKGLGMRFGSVQATCRPDAYYSDRQLNKNVPASACNVKYVYDGSDYVTFLRQQAINKNYNDISFGGDKSSGAQSVIRAIRRY